MNVSWNFRVLYNKIIVKKFFLILFPCLSLTFLDSCVAPVFEWKCQLVCPERAGGVPAGDSLIPMIGVISVATEATMPMTAIASARGVVEAGESY